MVRVEEQFESWQPPKRGNQSKKGDLVWLPQIDQHNIVLKGNSSSRTRHIQKVANIKRKQQATDQDGSTTGSDAEAHSDSQDMVSVSDTGATLFLNTKQHDYHSRSASPPAVLLMPFDSVCTPVSLIDTGMKTVLQYITNAWVPSTGNVHIGGLFGAFSPVWPGDDVIARDFLTPALQSSQDLSLFSTLTLAVRRMVRYTDVQLTDVALPDYYSLRAVQSLRRTVETRALADDQVILDLTLLVLSELYTKAPSEIKGIQVYWNIIRDCIVLCGGITKIRPRVLRFIWSMDALVAGANVTLPVLDILRFPEMMGPCEDTDGMQTLKDREDLMISQLDERSRTIYHIKQQRTEIIQAIQNLPRRVTTLFRACIARNLRQVITCYATPLSPRIPGRPELKQSPAYPRADLLYNIARGHAHGMWYWFTALTYMPTEYRFSINTPRTIENAMSEMWFLIQEVQQLLVGGNWFVKPDIVLWMAAVGFLVVGMDKMCCAWSTKGSL